MKNKLPENYGCGDPNCPNCVGKEKHPLTPDMERARALAGDLTTGVIVATKHMMQAEHTREPFTNRTMSYVELQLQIARCHFAEAMIIVAQQETITRKEMKAILKDMHNDFTDWFQGAINSELDKVADHYDQIRSEGATKQ